MKKPIPLPICLLPTVAFLALMLQPVIATASGWERLESIHFNSGQLDFGTTPRRGIVWYEPTDRPLHRDDDSADGSNGYAHYELDNGKDEALLEKRTERFDRLFQAAFKEENAGHWAAARRGYERLGVQWGWTGNVRDRVEVLARFLRLSKREQERLLPHLRRYLHALALLENEEREKRTGNAERAFRELSGTSDAGFLQEHALYQQASAAYQKEQYKAAIPLYQQLVTLYPHSVKTEAALIMLARASILPAQAAKEAQVGMDAAQQLLRSFPHTRFRSKAIGLIGRYHLLAGHVHQAAACYLQVGDLESAETARKSMLPAESGSTCVALFVGNLRRLGEAKTYYRYEQTIYALDRLTKILSTADAFRVSVRVVRDPEVGAAYLYYRIYHCHNRPAELVRLAHLADKIEGSTDWHRLAPFVRVRLAEAFYQAQEYSKALAWTERAAVPETTDRVLFVRGATRHKMGRHHAAIADFNALLQRFPHSSLRHGAREELALLYEAVGDMQNALKQYFQIGYQTDTAFLLDVRMTLPELESYYQRYADSRDKIWDLDRDWAYMGNTGTRPQKHTERELVAYSLGIRYMRKEKWEPAQTWFRRMSHATYLAFSKERNESGKSSPDPLKAIQEIIRLQNTIRRAGSGTARAAAMYRYATYYYTHGTLLLYNSAAWLGERRDSLADSWNESHFTDADEAATRTHMYEHEVYARALVLCEEIARRYPHTPTAPRALYRAACCANYLSNFNEWWRTGHNWRGQGKQQEKLAAEAARLMNLLVQRYPKDPLAPSARKYARVFAGQEDTSP